MTVSDVHVAKQRCVLAEAAWSAQRHHMRWDLLNNRGLVCEPLGEPPWYSYATAPSDCKVHGQRDWFQGVGLPDEWDTSEGSYSINLISCSWFTAEKTFWQEVISSIFLLAVQKNSVSCIVDEVHAFIAL